MFTSRNAQRPLDLLHVDLVAQGHAFHDSSLQVTLRSFGFDVLLDGIDRLLVADELLLDLVQTVVDIILHDLILLRVVLHGVESHLLGNTRF